MYHNWLMTTFILEYAKTQNLTDLKAFADDFCSQFDLLHLTYYSAGPNYPGDVTLKNGNLLITSYPERWSKFYFENKFDRVDPVLSFASNNLLPFDWGLVTPPRSKTDAFFVEAERHGLGRQGVTATVRDQFGNLALISANSDQRRSDWKKRWADPKVLGDFQQFATHFHLRVLKCVGGQTGALTQLSHREQQVLQWAAEGKTAWETAKILDLSEGTVNFYVRNACRKLGVRTKTQAISRLGARLYSIIDGNTVVL